jgi:hypothetical protein
VHKNLQFLKMLKFQLYVKDDVGAKDGPREEMANL